MAGRSQPASVRRATRVQRAKRDRRTEWDTAATAAKRLAVAAAYVRGVAGACDPTDAGAVEYAARQLWAVGDQLADAVTKQAEHREGGERNE